ncbi:MAG: hypothetical protein OXJ53_13745 [Gammaproteobacteria bacterium]|nr:hypothetical protein [Gammaproteobacteria bacterium]MDE0272123.1 hypothetical protein [Gammaproteobacteria bacterium]
MLDELVRTIESLRKRIQSHGLHIGDYEKRTRVSLIDPLLSALGWDVSDPSLVEVETKTDNGWADYALLNVDRQPLVFIEAKKLKEPRPAIEQVVGYVTKENVNGANIRYCVCTNGDYWHLLDVRSQNPAIMRTSISQGNVHKVALNLVGLWRPSLQDGVYAPVTEPIVETAHQDSPAAQTKRTTPQTDESAQPATLSDDDWMTLDSRFEVTGRPPPTRIRLPDGTETDLSRWREVIIQAATWLYSKTALFEERWSRPFGNKYLFSADGNNPDSKKPFNSPEPIVKGELYLETSLSNKDMLRYTKAMLDRCGYSAGSVHLKLSS